MNKTNDFNALEKELDDMLVYIQQCEGRIARGESIDLSGLDQKTEDICAAIIALPRDEGQQLADKLTDFVAVMDRISDSLRMK